MTTYVLSPLAKISRLNSEGRPVLHAGSGDDRAHFTLDGAGVQPLIDWLLGCQAPANVQGLADALGRRVGLFDEDARDLVQNMIDMKVLVSSEQPCEANSHLLRWGQFGWRDAADFHLATHGLRFVPDEVDGITYAEQFGAMLDDTATAGEQPPAHVPHFGPRLSLPVDESQPTTLGEVLAVAQPINRFDGPAVRGRELLAPLRLSFGTQRAVGGMLGEHHLRSYPSGGARHPFEIYLISKGIADVDPGVYQFDPVAGDLGLVPDHGDPDSIDAACFGKGGILTAQAVLVLTCRWLRHSWKYRYARSYRMLLLEAGHIVQAINLSMLRYGVDVYHCPSISDHTIQQILALGDDCAEGPVHALGLGHGGTR